jgi:hypothetical protein
MLFRIFSRSTEAQTPDLGFQHPPPLSPGQRHTQHAQISDVGWMPTPSFSDSPPRLGIRETLPRLPKVTAPRLPSRSMCSSIIPVARSNAGLFRRHHQLQQREGRWDEFHACTPGKIILAVAIELYSQPVVHVLPLPLMPVLSRLFPFYFFHNRTQLLQSIL